MYRLTDIMLQNLEKDLKKFHELFQGGRCQAWQLEELIAKAIRSDFARSEKVIWKGNGHDIGCDIMVNDEVEMQIKSGTIKNNVLTLSGHRLGRFKGDMREITDFLNQNAYLLVAVPYYTKECEKGKTHIYQLFYIDNEILQIDNWQDWKEVEGKTGSISYSNKNKHGVDASIRPSMSWQIWWNIPLSILDENDRTRLITIN